MDNIIYTEKRNLVITTKRILFSVLVQYLVGITNIIITNRYNNYLNKVKLVFNWFEFTNSTLIFWLY